MNLSQLYYFKKLAETQHYTKASKELFITQPSLSSAIAALENELGVPLFEKKGRKVELSKYGKEFLSYVTDSLNTLERGISSIKEKTGLLNGTIDIGCIPTLLGTFLPAIQKNYLQKNPLVHFNTYYGMSREVAQGVASGKYDIGFCSMVEGLPDLAYIPVTYQELVILVSASHPLASRDEIMLSELKPHKLITYRQGIPIGKVVYQLLSKSDISADYAYDDEISIAGKISTSSRVGFVADTAFLKQFDDLKKIHLKDVPLDTRLLYMVVNKEKFHTAIMEDFSKFIIMNEIKLP